MGEISKKGISRSFRATANKQKRKKKGRMQTSGLLTKTHKEKLFAFFYPFIFLKFGEIFQVERRREKHGIEYIFFHNSRCSLEFANISLKSSEFKV